MFWNFQSIERLMNLLFAIIIFAIIFAIIFTIVSVVFIKIIELFLPNINYLQSVNLIIFLIFILGSMIMYIFINKINEILTKIKNMDDAMSNMSIELNEHHKKIKQNSNQQSNLQKDFLRNELLLNDLVKKYEEHNKITLLNVEKNYCLQNELKNVKKDFFKNELLLEEIIKKYEKQDELLQELLLFKKYAIVFTNYMLRNVNNIWYESNSTWQVEWENTNTKFNNCIKRITFQ
jgi:ABC-type multidrug transport system fused ATPase/permease subunit